MLNSGFRDNYMLNSGYRDNFMLNSGFCIKFTVNPGFRNNCTLQQEQSESLALCLDSLANFTLRLIWLAYSMWTSLTYNLELF